nr:MAG TPA: A-type inclusion protein repeat protein [Caudoviricetes sp.]
MRSRLCELEQRLVECECEHLGSNYFYVFGDGNEKQIRT